MPVVNLFSGKKLLHVSSAVEFLFTTVKYLFVVGTIQKTYNLHSEGRKTIIV